MATMNISLPTQMKEWIEMQVMTGKYSNASDLVRALIRRDQERREYNSWLDSEVEKGHASGFNEGTVDELFDKARQAADALTLSKKSA